jgi:membrane protein YqaA with SNARE-associated domain
VTDLTHGGTAGEEDGRTPAGTPGDRQGGRLARWAAHPAGPALLFGFAVLEGCLFPAPTEALQAALAVARPRLSWWLTAIATAGSVAGGLVAYAVGALFFERMGAPLLERHGLLGGVERVAGTLRDNAALALVTSGYTPVPYLLYGVTAGAVGIPLLPFVAFSVVGRGLKYAFVGVLARWLGQPLRRLVARRPRIAVLVAATVGGLAAAWLWLR